MTQVQLAVYDLSRGMAASMSQAILGQRIDGIWHTGIIVFGNEYFFGGGIQVMPFGAFAATNGMQPVQLLDMGQTAKSQAELQDFLRSINHQFTQATYDLINNNCNNFADRVCNFLTSHGIPRHIVDLPNIVFSTPGGAMLRPMIENMQNNIHQQSMAGGFGSMDPFGTMGDPSQASAAGNAPQQFESAIFDAVHRIADEVAHHPPTHAHLEEMPLLSADGSTVAVLGNKLLNLPSGPGADKGSALSEAEKAILSDSILSKIANPPADTAGTSAIFTVEGYDLLNNIMHKHTSAHLAVLFILRIMLLRDTAGTFAQSSILRDLCKRLANPTFGDNPSFSGIPAQVMAICAFSNLLGHGAGVDYLFCGKAPTGDDGASNEARPLAGEIVDIALSGLSHSRAEVRQMSATLAYNFTLACTKGPYTPSVATNMSASVATTTSPAAGAAVASEEGVSKGAAYSMLSGIWKDAYEDECSKRSTDNATDDAKLVELHPFAVQLLCGTLEEFSAGAAAVATASPIDTAVRYRRLATACRIMRAYGKAAATLSNELGFADVLHVHQEELDSVAKTGSGSVVEQIDSEKAVVSEMIYLLGA